MELERLKKTRDFLQLGELSDIFGVSKGTIHRWIRQEKLPPMQMIAGLKGYDPKFLRDFLKIPSGGKSGGKNQDTCEEAY